MARGTRAEWAERVGRWRESGLTAQEFAARHRLKRSTLVWWSSALARAPRAAPPFVEVLRPAQGAEPEGGLLEVVLRDGLRVRVSGSFDAAVLLRLLAALEAR